MAELKNAKREMFCQEYLALNNNATQAMIKAGYAKRTAYSSGQRMLKNVEVQARIKELKSDRMNDLGITQMDILREYKHIGFANVTDVFEIDDDGSVKIPKGTKKLSREITAAISGVQQMKDGSIKLTFHPKQPALDALNRHFEPESEKDKPVVVNIQGMPEADLDKRLAELEKIVNKKK
jgi:phage terminase small subunit